MTLEETRDLFPHIKTGRIYFNHASIGPVSNYVKEKLDEYIYQRNVDPIENYQSLIENSSSAKKRLAKMLNAKKNRLGWIENVSTGINLLAQGLDWETGDRIILNDLEFPSNVYPFMNLKSQGVEIDFAESKKGKVDVEDYEKLITPKTKLISISLVQFLSGYRAGMKTLGELCKKHNIIFCVDAIQATGTVQIDVEDWDVDFLAGGSHKWLMGLQGIGYVYVKRELMKKINQKYVGWSSVDDDWNLLNYDLKLKNSASRYQLGTNNAIGKTALNASLELFEKFGMENVEERILDNTKYFIEQLTENGFDPLLKDIDEKKLAGITSIKIDNAQGVFNELQNRKINAAMREGILRFAPHYYNTKEEIDEVVNQLKSINKKNS